MSTPPCQKYACAIQDCLTKNNYNEDKCQEQLAALRDCCVTLLDSGGTSPCCPESKYGKKTRGKEPAKKQQHF
ncbi:hypothetical protein BCR43DRAFT_495698, partial [Syncephalastrum racemosum]